MHITGVIYAAILSLAGGSVGPEFVTAPIERPPDAVGQGPYVEITAAVVLEPNVKEITGETLIGEAGTLVYGAHSTAGDAHFIGTAGLSWTPSPQVIQGGVQIRIDAFGETSADSTEYITSATLVSPQPPGSQLNIPRFTLTQDALIRVIYEIDSTIEGAVQGHNASFIFRRGDAIGTPSIIHYEAAPPFRNDHYSSQKMLLFELNAGPYDFAAHLAYQGTMIGEIQPIARVDAHVDFYFEIIDLPQFSDCISGPNQLAILPCEPEDGDLDGDVDLKDFAIAQQAAR